MYPFTEACVYAGRIDWQCLLDAARLLARCRYTLQYTYPYAYYMEAGPRKELVRLFFHDCSILKN